MSRKKVLIVEDEAIIASFIQLKLEELGYQVVAKALTGEQAIRSANDHQPDIILMDINLEGTIDGIQAVEEITKTLDIPVIYLTASSDEYTVNRLMKTEPHGFLIKPFDDRILSTAIHIAVHRHRMKKELSEMKEMLRTTLQSIDDMVFSLDIRGFFTHHHSERKHPLEIFNPSTLKGKSIYEVFPVAAAGHIYHSIQAVLAHKKTKCIEFSIEGNGIAYWFTSKITLCRDAHGNISGITMVISDVTESKNVYHELVISQEKLNEAQNIARLGSCDVFIKEQRMLYNDLFFEILDITNPEIIKSFDDNLFLEIIHPDDRSRYRLIKKQVLEEKRSDFSADIRIIDQKNNTRFIHLKGRILFDKTGSAVRIINTIQDITWQKNNDKLRHDVELAQHTAQMKQKFFARLSHEIRNPLNGITGMLQLMEKTHLNEQQNDYIQAIKTSSDTMLALLNDVMGHSKIESGMMKVKPVDFFIRNTIKNLHTFYTPQTLDKNIQFRYFIHDNIPPCILGDESKIVQLISNLLSNAFKFTDAGEVMLRVECWQKPDNSRLIQLRVEVEDSGPGISDSDKLMLFNEYSQLDSSRGSKIKGSGLGLSICRQLVELMQGDIGVSDAETGKGSLFWFTLPVLVSTDQSAESDEAKNTVRGREKLNCSVLLVEDMLVNQKVIKLLLEEMGCKVSIASNGSQAIEMFKETLVNAFDIFARIHYDIILMDHMMPVMDGLTALHKLKSDFSFLPPVFVLTADESFAQDQNYIKNGFDDCIIKPVKALEMYEKIKAQLSKKLKTDLLENSGFISLEEIERKPVINPATLDMIVGQASKNNFNIELLFESFIEDMDRIHEQTLTAIEMNDYHSLRLIILTVKGLSGNMGASQLYAVAKLIDRFIRNDQMDEAKSLLPLLTEKYNHVKARIEGDFLKTVEKDKSP
jgi:PAS domain S-box-containing protein